MIQCKICSKELKNNIALGLHVKQHNLNSQQYYNLYLKKPNEGICPVCGKPTKWWSLDKGYMQHCSYKCTQNDKNVIHKRELHFIKKYGVKNPYQAQEVKDMIVAQNLERYGYEYNLQRPEIIEKGRQTKLKLYGSPTYNNSNKAMQTCMEKYGTNSFSANKKHTSTSKKEAKLYKILKKYCLDEIILNTFDVIFPLELDIFIPSLNLAFEYNGSYWHSTEVIEKSYHYNKSIQCYNKGIRLIHFYEFESWEYIEDFICKLFNNTEIITNDFNKYSPLQFNKKADFSGPQLLKDNVYGYTIYGSGTFTIL